MSSRFYHLNENLELEDGPPPDKIRRFGEAPAVITDSCAPYYHPGACTWTDSKSAIDQFDKACGTITTDKKQAPNASHGRELKRAYAKDRKDALHKAFAQVKSGNAPLTEEVRQKCRIQNEVIQSATGVDWYKRLGVKKR